MNKVYWLALAATLATAVVVLRWSWENGAHPAAAPDARTQPGEPPLHSRTFDGPGLWGMGVTLLADGALYLSLLFGWFYLWTVSPQWRVPDDQLNGGPMLVSALLLSAGTFWLHRLIRRLRAGDHRGLLGQLALLALLALVQSALLLWLLLDAELAPTETAHDAVIFVLLAYSLFHCALAAVATGLQAWRVSYGYVGEAAPYEPVVVEQLWYYNLGVLWVSYAAIVLFPSTWGGV